MAPVREQLNEMDPALPLADVRLMDDVLERAQSRPRFLTLLLSLFSMTALAIATVGIYGVVSYSVARRTKEFGLRMVLGAQTWRRARDGDEARCGMVVIGLSPGWSPRFADATDGEFVLQRSANRCAHVCQRDRGARRGGVGRLLHAGPASHRGGPDADVALRVSRFVSGLLAWSPG